MSEESSTPNKWTDRDLEVAYLIGVMNGAPISEGSGRALQEMERIKTGLLDIKGAVRWFTRFNKD